MKPLVYLMAVLIIAQLLLLATPSDGLDVTPDMSLGDVNASFWGDSERDYSGYSVAGVGDVNRDGYDDIVIGTSGDDYGGENAGHAYLIFGKRSGWSMDTNLSAADASFYGEMAGANAGNCVAGAGDVNKDGYDDIIIGASGSSSLGPDAGEAYLILGKATGWSMYTNLSGSDASFWGETWNDHAGAEVSGAGDVNGDGFNDFLISAPYFGVGETYLILGKASGWRMDTSLSTADASFRGEAAFENSGDEISAAGDVNGDGYDDFLIGTSQNDEAHDDAGQTYLILGKATGWAMDTSLSEADASFWGERRGDGSGASTSGAGDINGDGFDDILIGATGSGVRDNGAGQTYLVLGKTTGWAMDTDLSTADASFLGEDELDGSGLGVAGVGDVNGDGYDDFIIGASRDDDAAVDAGQTYLYFGAPTGWSMDMDIADAPISFWGEGWKDYSGYSLSGAGDVNGDGFDDILIGSHQNSEGGRQAGQTYLIFPDRNTPPTDITSVDLYFTNGTHTRPTETAYINDTILIRVNGTDSDPDRKGLTEVTVTSSQSSSIGIKLRLLETDFDSGTFEGTFRLSHLSHEGNQWIGTSVGETVTVTSNLDLNKKDSLRVTTRPLWADNPSQVYTDEDAAFSYTFALSEGVALSWGYGTNLSWLNWDEGILTISGTPTNEDVGTGYVEVHVYDDHDLVDTARMNITVVNVPLKLIGDPSATATEDVRWYYDFDSTDDGQGDITWQYYGNASWLGMDTATGEVQGTPSNEEVGPWWVNVSVDDGNGGVDRLEFTVEVLNVGDAPVIITMDLPGATEDAPYSFTFEHTDQDRGDSVTWTLENDIGWLVMDAMTGTVQGTPSNDDVGSVRLEVAATDSYGLEATIHLDLRVQNVNDPPSIITEDVTSAEEDSEYRVEYSATDPDVGDVLFWSAVYPGEWLSFDRSTGVLSGTPTNDDIGPYFISITVSDAHGEYDSREFMVDVAGVNDPPEITSELDLPIEVLEDELFLLTLEGRDEEDILPMWSDDTDLFDISSGGGTIAFRPAQSDIGDWWVNITAEDSEGLSDRILVRFTVIGVNDVPFINSISPENGTQFKEGEAVTLSVSVDDPDGDDLTVTWKLDGVAIGTGDTLDYAEMEPGTRTIKVTVSDGDASVEEEFVVIITKKEEESPGFNLVMLLIAVITAAVIASQRRDH